MSRQYEEELERLQRMEKEWRGFYSWWTNPEVQDEDERERAISEPLLQRNGLSEADWAERQRLVRERMRRQFVDVKNLSDNDKDVLVERILQALKEWLR